MLPRTGFEPVTYGLLLYSQLQSTALPTELSRVDAFSCSSSWLCPAPHHQNLTFTCFKHKAEMLVQEESPPQYSINKFTQSINTGGVAQMVERSLSMREVPGSIPGASIHFWYKQKAMSRLFSKRTNLDLVIPFRPYHLTHMDGWMD